MLRKKQMNPLFASLPTKILCGVVEEVLEGGGGQSPLLKLRVIWGGGGLSRLSKPVYVWLGKFLTQQCELTLFYATDFP